MTGGRRIAVKVIFNTLFLTTLLFFIVLAFRFGSCFGAASRLPRTRNYEMVRVLVYGTSRSENGDTVSAVISVLDVSGNECAVLERSWKGSSLAIDFRSAEFSGRKFIFPAKVYGMNYEPERGRNEAGWSGTSLFRYYNENRQCMLLGSDSTYRSRNDLFVLSRFALNPLAAFSAGFSRKYTADLSLCEPGVYYSIVTDSNGTLKIEKE